MDARGVRVSLDTSGSPLMHWATSGRISVIKPNAEELASAVGRDLNTIGDVIEAGRELCHHGTEVVLASLGSDGLIAVTKDRAWSARTTPVKVLNTVGAGDATLAGFLSAVVQNPIAPGGDDFGVGYDIPKGIATAVQWGAIAVTQPTSGLENLDNMPQSFVTENPDPTISLKEVAHI